MVPAFTREVKPKRFTTRITPVRRWFFPRLQTCFTRWVIDPGNNFVNAVQNFTTSINTHILNPHSDCFATVFCNSANLMQVEFDWPRTAHFTPALLKKARLSPSWLPFSQ
jgi:hypothetical protein